MEQDYKLIGAPCAVRGPYTFYKAFKYTKNAVTNILTINEFFFVKLWNDSDLISIGELRLLWEDQSCDKALASLRLYILPENTPDGRIGDAHGEDEVLAITEKVIIKLEDLLTWITDASDWNWGLASAWTKQYDAKSEPNESVPVEPKINGSIVDAENKENNNVQQNKTNTLGDCSAIDYTDVLKEKTQLDLKNWETRTGVVVLSYSRYCRYRALLRRLEGVHNDWLRDELITALGGFATTYHTTKILFCRDTFDYPELEGHELLCNHLAPKLRSRIPKKKKTLYPSPDASETDASSDYATDDDRSSSASTLSTNSNNSLVARCSSINETGIKKNHAKKPSHHQTLTAQQAFTQNLYAFMKARLTPIGKLPLIGNKEINLYEFYNKVKLLGSYSSVTNNKLWKYVFEELGGNRGDPSMATLMRKYYEKFLLPYEQHMLQQLKHSSTHQSTSGIMKSQHLPASMNDYRYQADRRKGTTIRPVPPGVRIMDSRTVINAFNKPVTGDKENIPLSDKRKLSSSNNSPEVIDLCAEEEGTSRSAPQKSTSSAAEVIDLCEELPIKRSIPSIAATLLPRKRKLDILREGGLEVTPVSTNAGSSSSGDIVTITRKANSSVATSAAKMSSDRGETSLEFLDAQRYSMLGRPKAKLSKAASQILDLRTIKAEKEEDVVKKFSPNLGPNIEISLVANDSGKREEKKRKPIPLPIPALRKISTGELSVQNFTSKIISADDICKPKVTITPKKASDVTLSKTPISKPLVSITSTITSTSTAHRQNSMSKDKVPNTSSFVPSVNQSFYLAALYNSIFPTSGGTPAFVGDVANSNPYHLQLTQQQINYVKGPFMHQPNQELDVAAAADAYAQKFTNMLKNGTVSIVENYEKILPD